MPPQQGSFWYNPQSTYGSSQNWFTSPFSRDFMGPLVPQGEFQAYLSNNNLGGFDRRSQFAQSQYGKSQSGWEAAKLNNPELGYRDYLHTYLGGNGFNNLYDSFTPEQRGEGGVARNMMGRGRMLGRG